MKLSEKNKTISKNLKILLRIFAALFMLAALFCALRIAAVWLIPGVTVRIRMFFFLIAGAVIFSVISVILFFSYGEKSEREKKVVHGIIIFYFAAYIVLFLGLVFFVRAYTNRESYTFAYNPHWLADSKEVLIPFKIIISHIKNFVKSPFHRIVVLFDVLGNLTAYMPLAFFLPVMSKDYSKLDSFLPVAFFSVAAVEIFQGMFSLGTCCTDDLTVGVLGALLMFGIMKIGKVERLLKKHGVYFYE